MYLRSTRPARPSRVLLPVTRGGIYRGGKRLVCFNTISRASVIHWESQRLERRLDVSELRCRSILPTMTLLGQDDHRGRLGFAQPLRSNAIGAIPCTTAARRFQLSTGPRLC